MANAAARRFAPTRRALSTDLFVYSPSVRAALDAHKPVVALESTIISHGMPFPQNVETARVVEDIIRSEGAEPATIAILDGAIHVGLTDAEMTAFGQLGRDRVSKTSRRDFAAVLARGGSGGTTVSGTMLVADKAGIDVFTTGGIGGVHRGAEETMDISADLTELGRTPVAVVCAGVKSILDIPKTLEYLETQGVTVTTHGPTADFPAFYTPRSGLKSPNHSPTIDECAAIIYANKQLQLRSGVVVAVPIPEQHAASSALIQSAIDQALAEAVARGIVGRDATPFLLARVAELTRGKSLAANIELIKNNAHVGGKIAARLAEMKRAERERAAKATVQSLGLPGAAASTSGTVTASKDPRVSLDLNAKAAATQEKRPIVVGGLALDVTSTLATKDLQLHSSFPGRVQQTAGGVGRNVAEAMHLLDTNPLLVSAVGDDFAGKTLLEMVAAADMDTSGIITMPHQRTAVYNAVHTSDGQLATAVADMGVLTRFALPQVRVPLNPSVVVVDGNVNPATFHEAVALGAQANVPVVFEPTSVPKASALPWFRAKGITHTTPNLVELGAMAEIMADKYPEKVDRLNRTQWGTLGSVRIPPFIEQAILSPAVLLALQVPTVVVKCGKDGIVVVRRLSETDLDYLDTRAGAQALRDDVWSWATIVVSEKRTPEYMVAWAQPGTPVNPVNVTGAGDTLVGTLAAGLLMAGKQWPALPSVIRAARRAAEMTLMSEFAVHPKLSRSRVGL
ncbi:hypothetical protein AMAG_12291 [Allomyces macrogynus ATCC 38327]|uniref:Carbohydrate kinase PfkB domain-containing protein n=1 Tax=Allomyces macrogynus (strain ATCC 38327) TaxID=578462 RepID=A0A0L0SXU8_ALLM3|nr:hypothetical protein AMAG_12291 [Allomyces macrogynus ATCC 38327]|eukprot:KNE67220.1 hypothetical protein AMAG_12291 [Allomyces macrogynus ATCC 38327]